jgi:hypothetical protein
MDEYQAMMTRKLGLPKYNKQLINKLLNNMAVDKVDYTNFFRLLSNVKADPKIPEDELLVPLKAVLLDIGQERKEAWISWVQSYVHEVKYTGIISSVWITIFTMLPLLLFSKLVTVFAPGYIWLIVSFAIVACPFSFSSLSRAYAQSTLDGFVETFSYPHLCFECNSYNQQCFRQWYSYEVGEKAAGLELKSYPFHLNKLK